MGRSRKRKPSVGRPLSATAKKLFRSMPSTRTTRQYLSPTFRAPLFSVALTPSRCIMKGLVSGFASYIQKGGICSRVSTGLR